MKKLSILLILIAMGWAESGMAAKKRGAQVMSSSSDDSYSSSSYSRSSSNNELLMDLTINYLRGTQPDQATDTAPRFSIGGMFTDWVGLDFQGIYTARSKNFLVGADLRLAPVEWLYVKGGIGGYSDKATRQFTVTPLAGTGIRVHLTQKSYFVTEATYYQVNREEFIGIGAGLGVSF